MEGVTATLTIGRRPADLQWNSPEDDDRLDGPNPPPLAVSKRLRLV
jgi:hypothetical protein